MNTIYAARAFAYMASENITECRPEHTGTLPTYVLRWEPYDCSRYLDPLDDAKPRSRIPFYRALFDQRPPKLIPPNSRELKHPHFPSRRPHSARVRIDRTL